VRPVHEGLAQPEGAPPAARPGLRRLDGGPQLGEVAVVAGGFDRRAKRRVDEAVGVARRTHGDEEHLCECRRDPDDRSRGGIDAAQLAVGAEAAERAVALGEEALDRAPLRRGRAADGDDATHRDEAVHAHEPPVES
jgi:hypothetical protein